MSVRPERGAALQQEEQGSEFGRTAAELDFWLQAVGAPLLVVERHDLIVVGGNRGASRFFSVQTDELPGMAIADLLGGEAGRMMAQIWSNTPVGTTGEPFMIRARIQDDERLLIVEVSKIVVEGRALRLFGFADAPPQGSVALAGWQEKIIDMLNWLPFGFEIASTEDQIMFANSHFNDLFGYSAHEVESIEDWWRLVYPDPGYREYAKQTWMTEIARARAENREMTPFDLDCRTKSGAVRTIQFRQRTIGDFNVNLYLDVTAERAASRTLKRLSETDALTEVMNRRRFLEKAQTIFEAGPDPDRALLMLDIDHFKSINDSFGHASGDLVLKDFARQTGETMRDKGLFARFGGEEFIALVTAPALDPRDVAETIRQATEAADLLRSLGGPAVTVSIGIAVPAEGETLEQVISRADQALYRAKVLGRNRVHLAD